MKALSEFSEYQLGESTFSPLEDDFKIWLEGEFKKQYPIIVTVSRRCSNLVALYLEEVKRVTGFSGSVVTENALLALADSLAEYYVKNKQFMSILIMDDILVHGRSLNLFLNKFEKIVLNGIKKRLSDVDMKQVQDSLYKSIVLSIYTINNAPFLLKQEYQWRLQYRHVEGESGIRKVSYEISDLLTKREIANTSYIISARVHCDYAPNEYNLEGWSTSEQVTRYGMSNQLYYLKGFESMGVIPSVRIYKRGSYQYYTPYCFLPRITADQLVTILRRVIAGIENHGQNELARKFIRYFNRIVDNRQSITVYYQLFELLLSHVALSIFLSFCTVQPEYDCKKIAANFDTDNKTVKFSEMLAEFVKIKWTKEDLFDWLACANFEKLVSMSESDLSPDSKEAIMHTAELKLYEISLNHEKFAVELTESFLEKRLSPISERESTGECELYSFLDEVKKEKGTDQRVIDQTTISLISFLTLLMDLGLISLKARAIENQEKQLTFYSALRSTEMTMSILPRLLEQYFMSFVRFTEFYWWEDDIEQRVEHYFKENICSKYSNEVGEKITRYAKEYAHMVHKYPTIVGSMLNWRFLKKNK